MGNESKISKYLEFKDLPAFFRDLADAIEKGGSEEFACAEDFAKFKISGKNEFGQVAIKAKFKSAKECTADEAMEVVEDGVPATPAKPKYKSLKKRMKSSFKMIHRMIHDGQVPPKEAVDSFLADSVLMVAYPGYGDEYYDDYTVSCEAFKAAYESGDIARMGETIDVISHEKSRCHAKYD